MTIGGSTNRGRICSQETKEKISQALIGHSVSDRVRDRMGKYNESRKGTLPKNHADALLAAHKAQSKQVIDLQTGCVFESKAACAAHFEKSVSWVNSRLRGHRKCKEEKFAEITLND